MMRSLYAGVSGLRNHQTRMDVCGNNIANVNTIGFKSGRVNFSDVLSQTLQGASSAQGNRGGTNPKQVGLGVGIASIDTIFTDGSFQPTGKMTDLSIQGQGFFVLSNGENDMVYTRAGNFDFDQQGNFLVPGTGLKVMGWMGVDGTIDTNQPIEAIQIPVGDTMKAKASTKVTVAKNLSANAKDGDTASASISVYDSLGKAHKINLTFTKTANANEWTVTPTSGSGDTFAGGTCTLKFDPASGKLLDATGGSSFSQLTITDAAGNADPIKIDFEFGQTAGTVQKITQFGGESDVQAIDQNGYSAGTLETAVIDTDGVIVGKFSNGQTKKLARVALATFNNPGGLNKVGESYFSKSSNSGEPQIGPSNTGGRGNFNPGTLEMSNVDLAQEFSNMIITQRGFQANSKIITTTDEMLQELANLKR